jgi:hypothetical protein
VAVAAKVNGELIGWVRPEEGAVDVRRGSIFGEVCDSSTSVPAELVAIESTRMYLLASEVPS